MSKNKRRILVTSALPYANGDIHLGHIVEHVQSNVWTRFQKLRGHECYAVCADDTHGAAVMLAAKKKGMTPEELIKIVHEHHDRDLKAFHVDYDNYYTTHSPENKELSEKIYLRLKENGFIEKKTIEQLYDVQEGMFLSDRFIKGECPKCHAKDQYGDNCEVCGTTYKPTELINSYSVLSGKEPVMKESDHYFFKLQDCQEFLKEWTRGSTTLKDGYVQPHLQAEALNKMKEWLDNLSNWDLTRDAPYFGFKIPGEDDKYFYVWLDAPVGYLASFKNFCERKGIDFEEFIRPDTDTEMYHFIGKDILYFHALFWTSNLHYANLRVPTAIFSHGFLTLNGEKMSKSRGTFITAQSYLEAGMNTEWIRYYFATKLNGTSEDIDLNLEDFVARVNSDLVGKYLNIASRAANFIQKNFGGKVMNIENHTLLQMIRNSSEIVAGYYTSKEYSKAVREIMALADFVNEYVDLHKPWELVKNPERTELLHEVVSVLINAFKDLTIYLSPIIPSVAAEAFDFLNMKDPSWNDVGVPFKDHEIKPYKHLMRRIEEKDIKRLLDVNMKNNQASLKEQEKDSNDAQGKDTKAQDKAGVETGSNECTIEDFMKIDLRTAKVLSCENVEGSDKLLKFTLDVAGKQRTIFSGIKKFYPEPEKLVGRNVIIIANLKPRKMAKFGVSEGMILSACDDDNLFLLGADDGAVSGMQVR